MRIRDIATLSKVERRQLAMSLAEVFAFMIPIGILGNFASDYFQARDYLHAIMAVVASLMLLGVFFLQSARRR